MLTATALSTLLKTPTTRCTCAAAFPSPGSPRFATYIGEWHYESIDIDPVAWAAEQREKEAARERQKRRLAEGVLAHQKAEAKERQANVAA